MKLVNVNAEGYRHVETVMGLIVRENPDFICMQESHEDFAKLLSKQGYQTALLPRCRKEQDGREFIDCELFASKYPFVSENYYYAKTLADEIPFETSKLINGGKHSDFGFILATIPTESGIFNIATTHFTWAPDGNIASELQKRDMKVLLQLVENLPAHIICGDFNIPRLHNPLYKELTAVYTDNIPTSYKSSLDKDLHVVGSDSSKTIMFEEYMVDYVFSQKPYTAENVRLEFGISDHAAVICEIEKK